MHVFNDEKYIFKYKKKVPRNNDGNDFCSSILGFKYVEVISGFLNNCPPVRIFKAIYS